MNCTGAPNLKSLTDEDFLVSNVLAHAKEEGCEAVQAQISELVEVDLKIELSTFHCLGDLKSNLTVAICDLDEVNSLFLSRLAFF